MDVVMIEAPGKRRQIERALGPRFRVFATIGHFWHMPKELTPLGIDRSFRETTRRPEARRGRALMRIAERAGRVYLATDADDEGEVIAADCAAMLAGKPLYRAHIRDLEEETIRTAIKQAATWCPGAEAPGTARRILDRIIGAVFSRDGKSCGRVLSPLLQRIGNGVVNSSCPAAPWNYAEFLLEAQRSLRLPVKETAQRLQHLYESGHLSYPRTANHGFSPPTRKLLEGFARRRTLVPDHSLPEQEANAPHEGLHPTRSGLRFVALGTSLTQQARDEALLALLTRGLVSSMLGTPVPWEARVPALLQADGLALGALIEIGLGRSSTYAGHATRMLDDGLVCLGPERLTLSGRGEAWRDAAPDWLREPDFSRWAEQSFYRLADQGASPAEIVRQIVAALPAQARSVITAALESTRAATVEPVHPNY